MNEIKDLLFPDKLKTIQAFKVALSKKFNNDPGADMVCESMANIVLQLTEERIIVAYKRGYEKGRLDTSNLKDVVA